MLSLLIKIGILCVLPHLGYSIYEFKRNRHLLRGQIFDYSLNINYKGRTAIAGININDPHTINDESSIEFAHKIFDYLPLTITLEKNNSQAALFIYPFATGSKSSKIDLFEVKVQDIVGIIESVFTPKRVHKLSGIEIHEKLDDSRGILTTTGEYPVYQTNNNFSQIYTLSPLCWDNKQDQFRFLLKSIIELGVNIILFFTIYPNNFQHSIVGQICISDPKKEQVMNAVNMLNKGGQLLHMSPLKLNHQYKSNRIMMQNIRPIEPNPVQIISLINFANLFKFCIQNISTQIQPYS